MLESVYESILARDLARRGLRVERQKPISFEFEGLRFPEAFRADLIIDGRVIVEIKSVTKLKDVHRMQLVSYLRLANCRLGLLLNFNSAHLRDGIKRVANEYREPPSATTASLRPLREIL